METIEIEPAIHAGARMFGKRVERAYEDPRSQVRFDDARRFFASGQRRYDVIVSEPSNPWVSGVSSLFTREFYAFLRGHLARDGVLVQWLQTYEIDDALLATIMAAVLQEFPQAELYLAHNVDLVIVAYPDTVHRADYARVRQPALTRELERVGLRNADELALRRIGGAAVMRAFVRAHGARPHSDFHPTVATQAPAARFRGESSETLQWLVDGGLPVLDILDGRRPRAATARIGRHSDHRFTLAHRGAVALAGGMRNAEGRDALFATQAVAEHTLAFQGLLSLSTAPVEDLWLWAETASTLAQATIGLLPAEDLHGAWIDPAWIEEARQPQAVRQLLAMYAAAARRDPAAMRAQGEAVLQLSEALPMPTQEHALVIAQLGAIGMRDFGAVERLYHGYGVALERSERFGMTRHLLRVWALDRAHEARR